MLSPRNPGDGSAATMKWPWNEIGERTYRPFNKYGHRLVYSNKRKGSNAASAHLIIETGDTKETFIVRIKVYQKKKVYPAKLAKKDFEREMAVSKAELLLMFGISSDSLAGDPKLAAELGVDAAKGDMFSRRLNQLLLGDAKSSDPDRETMSVTVSIQMKEDIKYFADTGRARLIHVE